jgi:hypothetical protein
MQNNVPVLSTQQILDCSYYRYTSNTGPFIRYGNRGCGGGNQYYSMYYASQFGLELERSYPYTGGLGSCAFSAPLSGNV